MLCDLFLSGGSCFVIGFSICWLIPRRMFTCGLTENLLKVSDHESVKWSDKLFLSGFAPRSRDSRQRLPSAPRCPLQPQVVGKSRLLPPLSGRDAVLQFHWMSEVYTYLSDVRLNTRFKKFHPSLFCIQQQHKVSGDILDWNEICSCAGLHVFRGTRTTTL